MGYLLCATKPGQKLKKLLKAGTKYLSSLRPLTPFWTDSRQLKYEYLESVNFIICLKYWI